MIKLGDGLNHLAVWQLNWTLGLAWPKDWYSSGAQDIIIYLEVHNHQLDQFLLESRLSKRETVGAEFFQKWIHIQRNGQTSQVEQGKTEEFTVINGWNTENRGFPPKSSILIGCSMIFTIHFGGFPPLFFGNTHFRAIGQRWGSRRSSCWPFQHHQLGPWPSNLKKSIRHDKKLHPFELQHGFSVFTFTKLNHVLESLIL